LFSSGLVVGSFSNLEDALRHPTRLDFDFNRLKRTNT